MRSSVARLRVPWRSSVRKRAYARSAAGEPASTPRKFGSWPPDAIAPFRTGRDASGAVRSSWIWNRLIGVFILGILRGENGLYLTLRKSTRVEGIVQPATGVGFRLRSERFRAGDPA